MAAISVTEKRNKRIRRLYNNIEAQILMTDDPEELQMLGALMLSTAKNIFLTRYTKPQARAVLHRYIDNVLA